MNAGFQQMSGVGMPQTMDGDRFGEIRLLLGESKRLLEGTRRNGLRCGLSVHRAETASRKQPDRMAVGHPILAQHVQGALGQRHIAIFVALAASDVDEHPGTVEVGDLQPDAFAQAQATGIDRRQAQPVMGQPDGLKQALHLVGGQDIGERLGFLGTYQNQNLPLPLKGHGKEGFDAAHGLGDGRRGPFLDIGDRQKILSDLGLSELIGRRIEMLRQHPHGADVGITGTFGFPLQLQGFNETSSEFGHTNFLHDMRLIRGLSEYIMEDHG